MGDACFVTALALLGSWIVSALARADEVRVFARFPAERQGEMVAALRLELAGRAALIAAPSTESEVTVGEMRAEAIAAGASHAVWIVFPGGVLAPAEVRVLDVTRPAPSHAMTPYPWDVIEPRVVAVLMTSLLEAEPFAARVEVAESAPPPPAPVAEPVPAAPRLVVPQPPPAFATASSSPAEAPAESEEPEHGHAYHARPYSIALGVSSGHVANSVLAYPVAALATGLTFYGCISDAFSLGVRGHVGVWDWVPPRRRETIEMELAGSLALGFRESIATGIGVELGAHVDFGIYFEHADPDEFGPLVGGGISPRSSSDRRTACSSTTHSTATRSIASAPR